MYSTDYTSSQKRKTSSESSRKCFSDNSRSFPKLICPVLSFGHSFLFPLYWLREDLGFHSLVHVSFLPKKLEENQQPWKSMQLLKVTSVEVTQLLMEETEVGWVPQLWNPKRGKHYTLQHLLIIPGFNLNTFLSKHILRQMVADQATSHYHV